MAANTTLPPGGGGDTIRNIDKAGVKTQVVVLDLGGAGAESLVSGTVPVSGTVTATGPLTDTQLRASAVPMSLAAVPGVADVTASGSLAALNATVALTITSGYSAAALQITGTWVGTITFEGTVDGTNWVSINGVVAGTSTPGTTTTANGVVRITPGGLTQIRANMTAFTSGSATVTLRASQGTGGTFLNQSLTAGANIIGKVGIDQTTPGTTNLVSIGTNGTVALNAALPTGANVIGAVTQSGTWTVTQQALTKATQGATGVTTQDLKDAGRSSRTITLDSFAVAAVTETLNTMSFSTDNGTLTTGTSYTVTAAKRFRMQAIALSLHSITGNTTAVAVIVRIRINNGGAAVVTSPMQFIGVIPGVATGNMGSTTVNVAIPDGYEIVAGAGIGVTTTCAGFVATTAAPKVDIAIMGYEY